MSFELVRLNFKPSLLLLPLTFVSFRSAGRIDGLLFAMALRTAKLLPLRVELRAFPLIGTKVAKFHLPCEYLNHLLMPFSL